MTLIMVGLIGNTWPSISSNDIPMRDKKTIDTSSWFHLTNCYNGQHTQHLTLTLLVIHVSLETQSRYLHACLNDKDCSEEVVEDLEGKV